MQQYLKVLQYLKSHRAMTKMDSITKLGVLNVGDNIMKLRRKGYPIVTYMIPQEDGSDFASCRLVKEQVMKYDITEHEWIDTDIIEVSVDCYAGSDVLEFWIKEVDEDFIYLNKSDAIVIAKCFGLTDSDLKEAVE